MKKRICTAVLSAMLLVNVFPAVSFAENAETKTITVMPYARQEIKGWGFFPTLNKGGVLSQASTSSLAPKSLTEHATMSQLINDFGITMFRQDLMVQCGNGDGSLNYDWMDKLVDAMRVMVDGGIDEYMLTAWGVPLDMVVKDAAGSNALGEEYEENYCKFVVNAFNYIVDSGLPAPIGFSIQNEPQDGRHWVRMRVEQYARVTKMMRKALDEAGFEDVLLLGPENAGYFQYFDQMGTDYSKLYEDPQFAKDLGALTTHAYYFSTTGSKPEDTYRFDMTASNFPHMERWETEVSETRLKLEDNAISQDLSAAICTAQILVGDVAWSGMNRWFYWNGFDYRQYKYPNGDIRFMDTKPTGGHQSLGYGDGYRWMKKNNTGLALSTIWKNVPVGSVVHRVWTDDTELKNSYNLLGDLVAFERTDGTSVLVLINESKKKKNFNINGLSGKSASVYAITDGCDQMAHLSHRNVINGKIKDFDAEPYSINVIVTEKEDTSAPKITLDDDNSCYFENGKYIVTQKDVTLSGRVDEEVSKFQINGEDIEVSKDGAFSYSFDASKTKTLNILCTDKNSGAESRKTVSYAIKDNFIKITLENVVPSTNNKSFVLKGHTNRYADITAGKQSTQTDENNCFELELSLDEGNNAVCVTAQASSLKDSAEFDIFCDSVKPEISIADNPQSVNDFEYLFTGKISEPVSDLKMNGDSILVHPDLSFEAKAVLNEGSNEIVFIALDKYGNQNQKSVNISYVKDENSPHFVNGIAYARKSKEPIEIDGNLSESSWKTDLKICRQVLGEYPTNNIANFGLLWDEKNLYIGAQIQDGKLYWDNKYPYLNDSIEFLLNPSNEKAGSFTKEDRQVFTGPVNGDLTSKYENKSIFIEQAYSIKDGKFTVEIAVPWSEMNKVPAIGEKIGFEIVNNDDDLGGSNRDSIQTWTSEVSDYYSLTTTFGTVELVDAGDFRYEDAVYEKKAVKVSGEPTLEIEGVVYQELQGMLDRYGSVYYDNPNTGVVNVFTSPKRKIDIKESAYKIFVDGNLVTLSHPVIKNEGFYYVDESFEKAVFANIPAFEKYPD